MSSSVRAVIVSLVLLTGLAGIVYPLLILGLAQAFFPAQADGSLVRRDDADRPTVRQPSLFLGTAVRNHADRLQCRGILRHESCSLKSAACQGRCSALRRAR